MEKLMGNGNTTIGQLIMDNHGTMNIRNNQGGEQQKKEHEAAQGNKAAIMEYVDRLKPMVKREFAETYDQLWDGILELREVKLQVYKKGKQQDTTFNRNLVAQIIHQISELVYMPTANTVKMAEWLNVWSQERASVIQ